MAVRKNKAQTTRRTYDPKRKVTSSAARDVRKNAEAIKSGGSVRGLVNILGAGLEPKIKPKPKSKIKTKTPKAGPGKKRIQGSGKTRGFSSTGGGGGEWATIKGRRIPLGKG
jgi:hypothetical protein